MTTTDLVQYLANVIHVVRADRELSAAEVAALGAVAADVSATKKESKDAERLAGEPEFHVRPTERYSDQIRNLEDMYFVALSDGALGEAEKSSIAAFAAQMSLAEDQIDQIASYAQMRATPQAATIACPKCGAQCPTSAKFCPQCASPVQAQTQVPSTRLEFDHPKSGAAIEFAESTVATFDSVLQAAKASPSYQEIERNKKRWFLAAWPSGKIADTLQLVANLKSVRNRKVYVDGAERPWDEVFGFLWCSNQREAAYRPVEYCFGADEKRPNLWGCKQLGMDWVQWADWLTYGKWLGQDTFQFDKDRVAHEVEPHFHKLRFCPHIRHDLVQVVLALLPDRVRVSEREGWKYRENYQQTPNSIKVAQNMSEGGSTFTHEFFADGVVPTGFEVAKTILRRALSQCGITEVDVRTILP